MFFNVAQLLVLEDGYSMSCAANKDSALILDMGSEHVPRHAIGVTAGG
jgi:hypothetical protein